MRINLTPQEKKQAIDFRIKKCRSQWYSIFKKEFIRRLENNLPLELDYLDLKKRENFGK